MTVLISLIGEQLMPNLLALRAESPDTALLVYSPLTRGVAQRLASLSDMPKLVNCETKAYDFAAVSSAIVQKVRSYQWGTSAIVFNLTGGTKTMALAAYDLAQTWRAPFIYLQSEGRRILLHRYGWPEGASGDNPKPCTLTKTEEVRIIPSVDEYVRMHVGRWWPDPEKRGNKEGREFEAAIVTVLMECDDLELEADVRWSSTMEADLVIRRGPNFAIAEVKQGGSSDKKEGLQQLAMNTRANVFGTYVAPLYIIDREMGSNNRALAEAFGIKVIELLSWQNHKTLSPEDRDFLKRVVRARLEQEGDPA